MTPALWLLVGALGYLLVGNLIALVTWWTKGKAVLHDVFANLSPDEYWSPIRTGGGWLWVMLWWPLVATVGTIIRLAGLKVPDPDEIREKIEARQAVREGELFRLPRTGAPPAGEGRPRNG